MLERWGESPRDLEPASMSVGSRLGSRRPVCMPRAEPEAGDLEPRGDPVSALREPPTHDALRLRTSVRYEDLSLIDEDLFVVCGALPPLYRDSS